MSTPPLQTLSESSVVTWLDWSKEALEGVENLLKLNLAQVRMLADDAYAHAHALLEAKDAQDMVTLQFNALQPLAEKVVAYCDRVYGITTDAAAEMNRLTEKQLEQMQSEIVASVDQALKGSPVDSKTVSGLLKSVLDAANSTMATMPPGAVPAPRTARTQPKPTRAAKPKAKPRRTTARRA